MRRGLEDKPCEESLRELVQPGEEKAERGI